MKSAWATSPAKVVPVGLQSGQAGVAVGASASRPATAVATRQRRNMVGASGIRQGTRTLFPRGVVRGQAREAGNDLTCVDFGFQFRPAEPPRASGPSRPSGGSPSRDGIEVEARLLDGLLAALGVEVLRSRRCCRTGRPSLMTLTCQSAAASTLQ